MLSDRSAVGTARWLRQHPGLEIISRDRCGLSHKPTTVGWPPAFSHSLWTYTISSARSVASSCTRLYSRWVDLAGKSPELSRFTQGEM